eukprot:3812701-Pleurochrysis_carterae.AAC.2
MGLARLRQRAHGHAHLLGIAPSHEHERVHRMTNAYALADALVQPAQSGVLKPAHVPVASAFRSSSMHSDQ